MASVANPKSFEESTKHETRNPKQIRISKAENPKRFVHSDFVLRACFGFRASNFVLSSECFVLVILGGTGGLLFDNSVAVQKRPPGSPRYGPRRARRAACHQRLARRVNVLVDHPAA
jgi:hypothetical protein